VLFRNEEQEMRKKLIEHDIVECVLGLGPNLFYNSPMEACIVTAYRDFKDIDGFAKVVPLDDIRNSEYNLSIPMYVRQLNGNNKNLEDTPSLTKVISDWQKSSKELRVSMDELFASLDKTGLGDG